MAGTDRTRAEAEAAAVPAPAVVLIDPQLGENIGTTARAMLNFGLDDLRLVRPRDGWPSAKATSAASGADTVVDGARLYPSTEDAIADLAVVYAATARPRDMIKPVATAAAAAADMRAQARRGAACGVLLGPERTGLHNDDIALADAVLTIPTNPAFASFNLAMAALLIGYEWFKTGDETAGAALATGRTGAATKADLLGFFAQLESALDDCGFLRVMEKRPTMVRNIRNIFQRARLTEQEVRTLRGIVSGLTTHPPKARRRRR
ncbi:MAG: RNA methyltransferase [Alphaproteobacteria bacterium]|nr:RNA methyltransferase [Alphaproteobacteria bacterium]MDP6517472.1 RNA methyltransferase [Alphaproteobacteria bacterium]